MTLQYQGIRLKSEVNPNTSAMLFPIKKRIARNNRSRRIEQVEVVQRIEVVNRVTKSNLKEFDKFFRFTETF